MSKDKQSRRGAYKIFSHANPLSYASIEAEFSAGNYIKHILLALEPLPIYTPNLLDRLETRSTIALNLTLFP